jgi:hypothetical protein
MAAAEREKNMGPVAPYQDQPDTPLHQRRQHGGLFHTDSEDTTSGNDMELAYQAQKMA